MASNVVSLQFAKGKSDEFHVRDVWIVCAFGFGCRRREGYMVSAANSQRFLILMVFAQTSLIDIAQSY